MNSSFGDISSSSRLQPNSHSSMLNWLFQQLLSVGTRHVPSLSLLLLFGMPL